MGPYDFEPREVSPRRRRNELIIGWIMLVIAVASGFFLLGYLPYLGVGLLFLGVIRLRRVADPALRRMWMAYAITGGLLMAAAFILIILLTGVS